MCAASARAPARCRPPGWCRAWRRYSTADPPLEGRGALAYKPAILKLLFVTSTRIGDAVLSTGLLDHLVTRHPGIRVTVACGVATGPLFAAVPGLDRVIVLDKWRDG